VIIKDKMNIIIAKINKLIELLSKFPLVKFLTFIKPNRPVLIMVVIRSKAKKAKAVIIDGIITAVVL